MSHEIQSIIEMAIGLIAFPAVISAFVLGYKHLRIQEKRMFREDHTEAREIDLAERTLALRERETELEVRKLELEIHLLEQRKLTGSGASEL